MKYFIKSKLRSKISRSRVKKWLEALESGEFRKTKGDYFHRIEWDDISASTCSFCALGVAAVVNDANMNDLHTDLFQHLLGFQPSAHDAITHMNDIGGLSFKAIAEQIRDDLKAGGISID